MNSRYVAALALITACDPQAAGNGAAQTAATRSELTTEVSRQLDVLVVVDNSGSMLDEQESLRDNFYLLINQLASLPGGLPDLHIGVVSTDLGAGPFGIDMCSGNGDNGALQSGGGDCGLQYGSYLSDRIDPETNERVRNYDGDLKEAFSCIGDLGTTGCGFEQPLEAVRRALDDNPSNSGFLRQGAHLAVVILADEDDCSVADIEMFNSSQDSLDSPLGPLNSFRCAEFGLTCDDTAIARGDFEYSSCVPLQDSPYMFHPDEYVAFLRDLKGNSKNVVVSVIAGDRDGLRVELATDPRDGNTEAIVSPSCSSSNGEADPAYRLGYFAEQFEHHLVTSICQPDLSGVMTQTGEAIETAMRGGFAPPEEEEESGDEMSGGCSTGGGGPTCLVLIGLLALVLRRRPSIRDRR